ncbi:unnamed protein product, partial [Didymodactylos carnosus]
RNAGTYSKVKVTNWNDCISQCCKFQECNVAYWIHHTCLHIKCLSDEMCKPTKIDSDDSDDDILYLQVRYIDSQPTSLYLDDSGINTCSETLTCPKNEQCEKVQVRPDLERNLCLCKENYRRINGVCRQYVSNIRSCHLHDVDACNENEECMKSNVRSKYGYCRCKLGFIRTDKDVCIREEQESRKLISRNKSSSTSAFSVSPQFIVNAGDDQTLILPTTGETVIRGRVLFQSNKSEISIQDLSKVNGNFVLKWSFKPSSNTEAPIFDQTNELLKIKRFKDSGVYEFELKLFDKEFLDHVIAIDTVKIMVLTTLTTTLPFLLTVRSPEFIYLPQSVVYLYANVSSDRKTKYEWKYMEDGPIIPTMEGTDTSQLILHDLRPGNYTFRIHVYDDIGNEQSKLIQIIVDGVPVCAKSIKHKQVVFWPSSETILDGTPSILESFTQCKWTLIEYNGKFGDSSEDIQIIQPQSLKTSVYNLHIGQYKFQLELITKDKKYTSKDYVNVIVYAQNGQPPKIQILTKQRVNILNNLIVIDASKTEADYGIASWKWTRTAESPATGRFINNSDASPIAILTQLHVGLYTFVLHVTDDRSQLSSKSVNITVEPLDENGKNLFQIRFQTQNNVLFTEQMLNNLLTKLDAFLSDLQPQLNLTVLSVDDDQLLLKTSGTNGVASRPQLVVNHLRPKVKLINKLLTNIKILNIDTYLCVYDCSGHGKCDRKTKQCHCDKYYMENWYKKQFQYIPNCGNSKLKNINTSNSDEMTDQDEETLYNKPLLTSSSNSPAISKTFLSKVSSKLPLSIAVQDSNGSPMVVAADRRNEQDQAQSNSATDNSVA